MVLANLWRKVNSWWFIHIPFLLFGGFGCKCHGTNTSCPSNWTKNDKIRFIIHVCFTVREKSCHNGGGNTLNISNEIFHNFVWKMYFYQISASIVNYDKNIPHVLTLQTSCTLEVQLQFVIIPITTILISNQIM